MGGKERECGQRLQQTGSGGDRNTAILGIGVDRAVLLEEDHVLAYPDGADAVLLGLLADDGQQLRGSEGIGGRYPEIDAHELSF